jgi:peroxiredoxin
MEHQTQDAPEPTATKVRLVAIIATVIALLAVSIPFVWDHDARAEGESSAPITGGLEGGPAMTPVSAHAGAGDEEQAACSADAKPAPDWTLPGLDGKTHKLSDYKGKVVLLNFWATWCGPCKAEIPAFVELQDQYKKDLTIIGLSVDDPIDKAKAFAAEYKVNYPMVLGENHEDIQDAYGPIWGIPASFIISRDGKICKKHMGIAPKSQFEKEIKALM